MKIPFVFKWLNWRFFKPPMTIGTSVKLKRLWWAYNDDPSFTHAYIISLDHSTLMHLYFRDIVVQVNATAFTCFEFMGERGVDWKLIDFGKHGLTAVLSKSDDWIVMAKLAGVNSWWLGNFYYGPDHPY